MPLLHQVIETETGRVVRSWIEKTNGTARLSTDPIETMLAEHVSDPARAESWRKMIARLDKDFGIKVKTPSTGNRPNLSFHAPGWTRACANFNVRSGRIEIYVPDPEAKARKIWPTASVAGNTDKKTGIKTPYGVSLYINHGTEVAEEIFAHLILI